jgi:hypothetical protein
VTLTITGGAPVVTAYITTTVAATFYVDNAMAAVSATVVPFAPLHPADEMERCRRYYQIVKASVRGPTTAAGQLLSNHVNYPTRMATTPTVTQSGGTSGVVSAMNTFGVTDDGLRFEVTSSGAGDCNVSSRVLTLEANP